MEPMMNSISYIIANLGRLSYRDRVLIKCLGPPRPDLDLIQCDVKKQVAFRRKYNRAQYDLAPWLCGCDERNAFFCFYCLLAVPAYPERGWARTGVRDLKHLNDKIKKHGQSAAHLKNESEYCRLGETQEEWQQEQAEKEETKVVTSPRGAPAVWCHYGGSEMARGVNTVVSAYDDKRSSDLVTAVKTEQAEQHEEEEDYCEDFVLQNEDEPPTSRFEDNKADIHVNPMQSERDLAGAERPCDVEIGIAFRALMQAYARHADSVDSPPFSLMNATRPRDDYTAYGDYVASKLRRYDRQTRVLAERAINGVLFRADMGLLAATEEEKYECADDSGKC